jgi:hypothetical protein
MIDRIATNVAEALGPLADGATDRRSNFTNDRLTQECRTALGRLRLLAIRRPSALTVEITALPVTGR